MATMQDPNASKEEKQAAMKKAMEVMRGGPKKPSGPMTKSQLQDKVMEIRFNPRMSPDQKKAETTKVMAQIKKLDKPKAAKAPTSQKPKSFQQQINEIVKNSQLSKAEKDRRLKELSTKQRKKDQATLQQATDQMVKAQTEMIKEQKKQAIGIQPPNQLPKASTARFANEQNTSSKIPLGEICMHKSHTDQETRKMSSNQLFNHWEKKRKERVARGDDLSVYAKLRKVIATNTDNMSAIESEKFVAALEKAQKDIQIEEYKEKEAAKLIKNMDADKDVKAIHSYNQTHIHTISGTYNPKFTIDIKVKAEATVMPKWCGSVNRFGRKVPIKIDLSKELITLGDGKYKVRVPDQDKIAVKKEWEKCRFEIKEVSFYLSDKPFTEADFKKLPLYRIIYNLTDRRKALENVKVSEYDVKSKRGSRDIYFDPRVEKITFNLN